MAIAAAVAIATAVWLPRLLRCAAAHGGCQLLSLLRSDVCVCLMGVSGSFDLDCAYQRVFGLYIGSSEYIHWENLSFKDSGHVRSLKCNVTLLSVTVVFIFWILGCLKLQFSGRTCAGHRASCAFSTGACRLRMHVSIIMDWCRKNFKILVFMSPAWQYLTMNVHCGLSRSSLLLGSARSCGSAGSALLRCLIGYQPKMILLRLFQDMFLPEKRAATSEST